MKKSLILLLIVLAAMLVLAGCGGDDSTATDGDTPDGDTDGDVPDGDGTDPDGDGSDPDGDGSDPDGDGSDPDGDGTDPDGDLPVDCGNPCETSDECADGCACDKFEKVCKAEECDTAADCEAEYGAGCWECSNDYLCYPQACRDSSTCCAGTACIAGVCLPVEACPADAAYILIAQGGGLIAEGATINLTATVFNADGAKLEVLGETPFTWETSNADAVAVAATGIITGGSDNGQATITAKLTCNDSVTGSVTYQNFAALENGSRVVVMDSTTGALIDGAPVYLNGTLVETDGGVAAFEAIDCATDSCDLHVFPATHTYVSAFGLGVNDILIPVAPNVDAAVAGGVKGHMDFSKIPAVLRGDVSLGLTLFSIPGNLADLNFESLIGELVNTHISIGATIDEWITLPVGLEGYLNETTPLKDGFAAQGIGGSGTLWGLGGFAQLTEIIELVSSNLSGDIEIGPIVAAILPLFENFYHGIKPGMTFEELPKVADVNDINADEDTTDLVPDFANFRDLGTTWGVRQAQSQNANVTFQNLPAMGDGCADSIITLVGAMESGVGFIPLGLNVALDETGDCKVGANSDGKVPVVFAPQHSGVSGYDYYVVSVALSISSLMGKAPSIDLSGAVNISGSSPSNVTMPGFLGYMSDVTWNSATHTATATPVAGATFHRIVFSKKYDDVNEQRYWHVYWGPEASGVNFTLPGAITDDRSANFASGSLAQAIKLNGVDYNTLFGFNGTNISDMNGFLSSFSMHALD